MKPRWAEAAKSCAAIGAAVILGVAVLGYVAVFEGLRFLALWKWVTQ